jgi:hypothetical protein
MQYAPNQLMYSPPNALRMPGPSFPDTQYGANVHESSQRRASSYTHKDLRTELGRTTAARSGVAGRSPSQRYAPRRQSDLRASSMTSKEAPDRSSASNSTPQHKKPAVNTAHKVAEPVPPARPHAMRRRRSSLASSSKFSIPERITEELEYSDLFDTYSNAQQTLRHDSGVDDLSRIEQPRSASLPGFVDLGSSHSSSLRVRNAPMLKMPRFEYNNTTDERHHKGHSIEQASDLLPVAREMAHLSSFNFGRNDSIGSASATVALSPTLHSLKTLDTPSTSIMNRRRADYAVVEPKTGRLEKLEAKCDRLEQVQGVQHPSTPMRTVSLRSSRSDRTVYSSFNSVSERDTKNKHTVHTAPSSPSRTQSLKADTQSLTMIDLIEQKERRARKLSSACQQWISRQKNMTRLGVDLKRS